MTGAQWLVIGILAAMAALEALYVPTARARWGRLFWMVGHGWKPPAVATDTVKA